MPSHRAEPRRQAAAPGRRRAEPGRPRYGRIAVLGASVSVTGIAMLGGVGVLPSVASGGDTTRDTARDTARDTSPTTAGSVRSVTEPSATAAPSGTPSRESPTTEPPTDPAVPDESGEGKRIVFDQSDQRVWLVDEDGEALRTYLVSGSLYDNLDPGTYEVYSRSAQAWGVDGSGTMKYFVRFTEGDNGAAIGFHDIPVDDGAPVQTVAHLGTPQSHGCIRQKRSDAIALWGFAPVGTEVDVVA